jgi:hypothetical protein
MKRYFKKNEEENFKSMDSTFTPIESAYFKQSKIEEIEVLFSIHVMSVRIRRITLPQEPFTSTCFSTVLCQAIIVGPSMKKEGLQWKIMKKGMLTTILILVILSWRMLKGKQKGKVKKRHIMILLGKPLPMGPLSVEH